MVNRSAAWLILIVSVVTFVSAEAADADAALVAVVSERVESAGSVSPVVLRRLFLGRTRTLGGRRIVCVSLPPGSPVRERLNREVLRLDEDALAEYWIEQALLGGALPPAEVETSDALIERVRERPEAIGFLLIEAGAMAPEGLRFLGIVR